MGHRRGPALVRWSSLQPHQYGQRGLSLKTLSIVCLLALALAGGCGLGTAEFAGKGCDNANDCPPPYVCALARPGQGRTCELLPLPLRSDAGSTPIGPSPDYCHDAKPILDRSCVRNCHGADTSGSLQTTFRLDQYDDLGAVAGAKSKADRIKVRISEGSMPPPTDAGYEPTDAERALISKWVTRGAQECLDGGR